MDIHYAICGHGVIHPIVSIQDKDSLPIQMFLRDMHNCEDTVLAWIDDVLAGRAEQYDWSGDCAFATIRRDNTLMEAQWVRDEKGTERGESLPTAQLRKLIVEWIKLRHSLS